MVSPDAAGVVAPVWTSSFFSAGFEQPVKAMLPIIAAASNVFENSFC